MLYIGAALKVAAQEKSEVEEGYSTDVEYTRHQVVNNRFFKRLSTKPAVRAAVQRFGKEVTKNKSLTRIKLDKLSSRTRIFLFRELTAAAKGEKRNIPFSFYGYEFAIKLDPSLRQPGDGVVIGIGEHEEIHSVLNAHKKSQKEIAEKLLKARKKAKKEKYHALIDDPILSTKSKTNKVKTVDLDMLNILLDFEVARRLQTFSEYDEKYRNEAGEHLDYVGDQGKEGEPAGDAESIQAAEIQYEIYDDFSKNISDVKTLVE